MLSTHVSIDFSLPAERVLRALDQLIEWRGKPGTVHALEPTTVQSI